MDLTGDNIHFKAGNKERFFFQFYRIEDNKDFMEFSENETIKLLDPTYDQAFKSIFTYGKNISSKSRLKSFLNSLLHNKYNEYIVNIEYSPNELAKLGDKGRKHLLVFDIIVKATFESKKYIFIDIEIQTTFHNQLFMRWIKYATNLFSNINQEILVLILQVDNREESSFWSLSPYMITYSNPIQQDKINGIFEIINIDLNKAIDLIKKKKPIQFEDIKIDDEGKNWLKIIGLRFWAKKEGEFFYLPKIKNNCAEILSTMEILSCFTSNQVKDILEFQKKKEKEFEDGYYKGKEDGYYEGKIESDLTTWMRLFKNNISIKDNGNLYPDIGKVAENTVQKLFSGDPYLETFLYFLKNNDKILNN